VKEKLDTPRLRCCRRAGFGKKAELASEFEQLIDGEGEYAEHQMRHNSTGLRTRMKRAPNSSFKRLYTRSTMVRNPNRCSSAGGHFAPFVIVP